MLSLKSVSRSLGAGTLAINLFFAVSCMPPKELEPQRMSTISVSPTPVVKPDGAARLTDRFSKKACREFYDAFPQTFSEFAELYGFEDGKGGGRLYQKYGEQIPYFFDCPEISPVERIRKVIGIGVNGKWDADAIGLYQDLTLELVKAHPDQARQVLDNLSDTDPSSFWYFLFDGPHPGDRQKRSDLRALQDLLGTSSKQSRLLDDQFRKLLKSEQEARPGG